MIIESWEGPAPDGEVHDDPYIPVEVDFPLDQEHVHKFSCYYRSTQGGVHMPEEGWGPPESMLEVVVDVYSGRLCRLVLVGVLEARYKEFDPGQVVNGDPVFDIDATLGDRVSARDRVNIGGEMTPSVDQYEQYELWVGGDQFTILFEGRATSVAIRAGAHLIVFVDEDREVSGFQITGVTPSQRAKIIDTITYTGKVIEGEDTFSG